MDRAATRYLKLIRYFYITLRFEVELLDAIMARIRPISFGSLLEFDTSGQVYALFAPSHLGSASPSHG